MSADEKTVVTITGEQKLAMTALRDAIDKTGFPPKAMVQEFLIDKGIDPSYEVFYIHVGLDTLYSNSERAIEEHARMLHRGVSMGMTVGPVPPQREFEKRGIDEIRTTRRNAVKAGDLDMIERDVVELLNENDRLAERLNETHKALNDLYLLKGNEPFRIALETLHNNHLNLGLPIPGITM